MDAKTLAEKLNGREYGAEITKEERREAAAAGLVVVFGASDDLMEFRGVIDDEVGCYGGGSAYLTSDGLLENECASDDCPHFKKMRDDAYVIEAKWDCDGYSWVYETSIPHATFEILEDGEKYCRGIVFALSDVRP
jgi:hypothetical protein